MGIKTQYMADADYVRALILKNKEHLENRTLSVNNIIIPELKTAEVTYTETFYQTVNTTYYMEIETYSEGDRNIIDFYLEDNSADGINKYDYEQSTNIGDSEYSDSYMQVKMEK
jgi:hypothetical protein